MSNMRTTCLRTMRREISYTAYCIALYLDIWAQHLADERFEAAKFHNKELVIRCEARFASRLADPGLHTRIQRTHY